MKLSKTRTQEQQKLLEQELMVRVIFCVLMYQKSPDFAMKARLDRALKVLLSQVNTVSPSYWLADNFIADSGFFRGFWWLFYRGTEGLGVAIDGQPFKPCAADSCQLVMC